MKDKKREPQIQDNLEREVPPRKKVKSDSDTYWQEREALDKLLKEREDK